MKPAAVARSAWSARRPRRHVAMRERLVSAQRAPATSNAAAAHSASRLKSPNHTLVSIVRLAKEMNT